MMLAVLLALTLGQSGAATRSNQPVYVVGDGVTVPRLLSEVTPRYTADAMRAKISGSILLEAVVQADGTVTDIHARSDDGGYRLVDAGMARIGGRDSQRWYYHVNFTLGSRAERSGSEVLTVVVLLDGSVVEPRVLTVP